MARENLPVSQKKNRRLFAFPVKYALLEEKARGRRYRSLRKKWPYFKTICMAVDFFLILIAYYAAFTLRHDVMGGTITVDVRSNGYIYLSIVYEAMMVLYFYLMHLYELLQVMRGTENIARIMLSAALGIVLLSAALFSAKLMHGSRLALMMI